MVNNPYIKQVKNHSKILTNLEEIYSIKWKWNSFFANKNQIILEIGTWLWNFFSKNVNENIWKNFIGMEIRYKRCFMTAQKTLWKVKNNDNSCDNTKLKKYNNNFVIIKDYAEKISSIFNENEINETLIFFPDPWARKKWLKKRLLQKQFLDDLYIKTKKDWKIIFKTDHLFYLKHLIMKSNDYMKVML